MGVPVTGVLPDVQTGNPYVGPQSFRAGQHLYGRAVALDTLFNLVVAERIVLLYSPSGAGKSSLINAALIPELNREGLEVLPVVRVNTPHVATMQPPPRNRYLMSTLMSLESDVPEDRQVPTDRLRDMTLAEYLEQRPDQDGIPGNEVLVFDQFEEVLSLDPTDEDAKREFFSQVGEALRAHRLWALFAIREDHLAALEPYLRAVPTRLRTRYRLDLLTADEAFDAVVRPAQDAGVEFRAEAAHALVDDLRQVRAQRLDGTVDVLGAYVEPVQLQLACTTIWARRAPGSSEITTSDGVAGGSVEQALADYYDLRVAEAARVTDVREDVIRDWFERRLITPQGLRGQVLEGPLGTAEADGPILRELEHLIRPETRRQATWYELSHDRFIEPVRRSNARWRAQHLTGFEQAAALWDENGRQRRLLLTGTHLASATTDVATRRRPLQPHEQAFLDASQALEADRRRDRRRDRWMRILAFGLAGLLVAALVLYLDNQSLLSRAESEEEQQVALFEAAVALDDRFEESVQGGLAAADQDVADEGVLGDNARHLLYLAATTTPVVARVDTSSTPTTVAQSQDGTTVVTVDSAVTVWSSRTDDVGRTTFDAVATIADGDDPVDASVSADGGVVTVALGDGALVAWHRVDGSTTRWDLPYEPTEVTVSPAGDTAVTFGPSGEATVWAVDDSARRPDGHRLFDASATAAGEVDAENVWPDAAAFSADGGTLAIAYDDVKAVRLWDVGTGRAHLRLDAGEYVDHLRFAPDGATLGTGAWGSASVWDTATGTRIATVADSDASAFAFDPGLTTVLSYTPAGEVRRHDVATGTIVATALLPGVEIADVLSADTSSPDVLVVPADGRPGVWRLHDDVEPVAVDVAGDVAYHLREDGTLVSTGPGLLTRVTPVVEPADVWSIDVDDPGGRAVTVTVDGAVHVWDVTTGALLREIVHAPDSFVGDASVAGDRVAVEVDGQVHVVDVVSGETLTTLPLVGWSERVELTPDGSAVVVSYTPDEPTVDADGDVEAGAVVPVDGGRPVPLLLDVGESDAVLDVAVARSGRQVALTTTEGRLALFDASTGRRQWQKVLSHGVPTTVAFSHDGLLVAAGGQGIDVLTVRGGHVFSELPVNGWPITATSAGRGDPVVVTLWDGPTVEAPLDDEALVEHVRAHLLGLD